MGTMDFDKEMFKEFLGCLGALRLDVEKDKNIMPTTYRKLLEMSLYFSLKVDEGKTEKLDTSKIVKRLKSGRREKLKVKR